MRYNLFMADMELASGDWIRINREGFLKVAEIVKTEVATNNPETASNAIEVDWFGEAEIIEVNPRDQQRFQIQKDRAISLLQLATNADAQLALLRRKLGEWMRTHSSSIKTAFLTLRDHRFSFVVISRTPLCNDELEDAVSDVDLQIANDPDLDAVKMNAIVLPPASIEAIGSFLDNRFLLEYRVRGA